MKILLAEDDVMLADFLADALADDGHVVCGIALTVAEAVALARLHHPEIAILDVQMSRGERGSDITDQLSKSGDLLAMGILYVTGGTERVQQQALVGHACLSKPYTMPTLVASLRIVRDMVGDGSTSRPLPDGLRLLSPAFPDTLHSASQQQRD